MNEVYYILIVNALLVFKLWNDKRLHNDPDKHVNHQLSAGVDMFIYAIAGWFLLGWDVGGWLVATMGYRWLVFDILFNLINGWNWAYCGSTSWLDKQSDKLDGMDNRCYLSLIPKLALIAGGILIIIYLQ